MAQSSKFLIQIVVNLLLVLIFLVGAASVIRDLLRSKGNWEEQVFLLVVLLTGVVLFVKFLIKLIRASRQQG